MLIGSKHREARTYGDRNTEGSTQEPNGDASALRALVRHGCSPLSLTHLSVSLSPHSALTLSVDLASRRRHRRIGLRLQSNDIASGARKIACLRSRVASSWRPCNLRRDRFTSASSRRTELERPKTRRRVNSCRLLSAVIARCEYRERLAEGVREV